MKVGGGRQRARLVKKQQRGKAGQTQVMVPGQPPGQAQVPPPAQPHGGSASGGQQGRNAGQAQVPGPGQAVQAPDQPQIPPPSQAQGGQRKRRLEEEDKECGDITQPQEKKRKKVDIIALGQSTGLNARHSMHFARLISLITSEKKELKLTDDPKLIIKDDESSHGLYTEWSSEKEANCITMSSASRGKVLKLELLAAFGEKLEDSKPLKPLLAFSKGFYTNAKWKETKCLLQKIFGPPDVPMRYRPNYIYAFTRISEKFHFRIFKINNWPAEGDESLKFELKLLFVMKPEVLSNSDGSNSSVFLEDHVFCMGQGTQSFDLKSEAAIHDSACLSAIPHIFDSPDGQTRFLPAPPDTMQWEGFNTTAMEFFDRYYAFKKTKVPGTGPLPSKFKDKMKKSQRKKLKSVPAVWFYHLCTPFKIFGRSLVLCCEDVFARQGCFKSIKLKDIFFRGRKLKILGIKLVPYSEKKAKKNLQQIGNILREVIRTLGLPVKNFPPDLIDVLGLLSSPGSVDNIIKIKNHPCWMDGLDKILMMDELHDEFKNKMSADQQLKAGKGFPSLSDLELRIDRNWLVKHCSLHGSRGEKSTKTWTEKKKASLECKLVRSQDPKGDADLLFGMQKVFKTPRNSFQHLAESAAQIIGHLTREEVEFVVASEYTDVYLAAQVGVTEAYATTTQDVVRSSFDRFGRFFRSPENMEIKDEDRK